MSVVKPADMEKRWGCVPQSWCRLVQHFLCNSFQPHVCIAVHRTIAMGETEQGLVICYGSMYGNTERVAEAIAQSAAQAGIKKIVVHNLSCFSHVGCTYRHFPLQHLGNWCPTYNGGLFSSCRRFNEAPWRTRGQQAPLSAFRWIHMEQPSHKPVSNQAVPLLKIPTFKPSLFLNKLYLHPWFHIRHGRLA